MRTKSEAIGVRYDPETLKMLDRMAADDGIETRSAFLRILTRREYDRRYNVVSVETQPHPADANPVPLVTVERTA